MNRIEYTTRLLGLLRAEKTPPITRYSIVLAAATGGPAGTSVREIAGLLGDPASHMGGCLQKIAEGGWIRCLDPAARPHRWTPTSKGLAIVARLTLASPATAAP